jgi:hypothetical protein
MQYRLSTESQWECRLGVVRTIVPFIPPTLLQTIIAKVCAKLKATVLAFYDVKYRLMYLI